MAPRLPATKSPATGPGKSQIVRNANIQALAHSIVGSVADKATGKSTEVGTIAGRLERLAAMSRKVKLYVPFRKT